MKMNIEYVLHEIYVFRVTNLTYRYRYLRFCYCAFLQKTMIEAVVQNNIVYVWIYSILTKQNFVLMPTTKAWTFDIHQSTYICKSDMHDTIFKPWMNISNIWGIFHGIIEDDFIHHNRFIGTSTPLRKYVTCNVCVLNLHKVYGKW